MATKATFYCNITGQPCVEPVITKTGYTFERANLEQWMEHHGDRCPVTGAPLNPDTDIFAAELPAAADDSASVAANMNPAVSTVPAGPASPTSPTSPTAADHHSIRSRSTAGGHTTTARPLSFYEPPPQSQAALDMQVPYRLDTKGAQSEAVYLSMHQGLDSNMGRRTPQPAGTAAPVAPAAPQPPALTSSATPGPPSSSAAPTPRRRTSAPAARPVSMANHQMAADAALVAALAQQDYRYAGALTTGGAAAASPHDALPPAKQYRPWFVWLMTALQIAGMVLALVVSYNQTGSPIQTSPQFNYLVGPPTEVLVEIGARFAPCIRDSPQLPAPGKSSTSAARAILCSLPTAKHSSTDGMYECGFMDLCGKFVPSSTPDDQVVPNQWYRFLLPLFLHAGVVHWAMNTLFQWTAVRSLERDWGWFRIAPVYIVSGAFGFIAGGSFSSDLSPSVGCSGALFGCIALLLIDHVQSWQILHNPLAGLIRMLFVVIVTFILGLWPGIDNFSHLFGFLSGLLAGFVVMPNINLSCCAGRRSRKSLGAKATSDLSSVRASSRRVCAGYSPLNLVLRAASLAVLVAVFVVMTRVFYAGDGRTWCSWCSYIDCIPALGQCQVGG
ncbi:hypothetical protein AMAG_02760 [Allomyces macrogynus ATCC 38327]|uniref:Rhomboid-type serine protease n=1 Tax=Allomyces macrogynus (strain ATCC 38327) TaxID=578462 RepID=A0A0L0S3N3_ALLM3|nr:hypothetical protein AMAG_02760 [Allomyces macrogynus ATCC 38327]|eukprot:KNE57000.1 hypothetical protein AMAG_02760 [Allomyces macrogynus ATCC 38327]